VTHDAGPRIDPRFDARFQRGYDGTSPPDPASDAPSRPAAVPDAPEVAPTRSEATAPDVPVDDAASAVERPVAGFGSDAVATTDATNSTAEGPSAAAPAPTPPEPLEPAEPAGFSAGARLWIALAVSVAFIVVGTGVLWALVSDSDYFMGRVGSASEQAGLQFTMNIAPGFVQAGVVGVVVVLVAWAVRAHRATPDGPDGRDRR
jgi:hypothetical protein